MCHRYVGHCIAAESQGITTAQFNNSAMAVHTDAAYLWQPGGTQFTCVRVWHSRPPHHISVLWLLHTCVRMALTHLQRLPHAVVAASFSHIHHTSMSHHFSRVILYERCTRRKQNIGKRSHDEIKKRSSTRFLSFYLLSWIVNPSEWLFVSVIFPSQRESLIERETSPGESIPV